MSTFASRAVPTAMSLALTAAIALGGWPALADPSDVVVPPACIPQDKAQAEADKKAIADVDQAVQTGGFKAVQARLATLAEVLRHAPASLHKIELCDGKVVVLVSSSTESLAVMLRYAAKPVPGSSGAVAVYSPYIQASLYLGAYYVQTEQWGRAVDALKRGLAIDPGEAGLANEAALALLRLHRADEGLSVIERALREGAFMEQPLRARLLRTKGFMLEELQRIEEAEASYKESLVLEPGNKTALSELQYIAGLRRGAKPTPAETIVSKTGETTAPSPPKT